MKLLLEISIAAFAIGLSACNGGQASPPPFFTAPTPTPTPTPPLQLYVADGANVDIFPVTASGNVAPTAQITGAATTLSGPAAVAKDSVGNLYVADFNAGAIDVFAAGSTGNVAPTRQIIGAATLINGPEGIAVDS